MGNKCQKCLQKIATDQKSLSCTLCDKKYHLDCADHMKTCKEGLLCSTCLEDHAGKSWEFVDKEEVEAQAQCGDQSVKLNKRLNNITLKNENREPREKVNSLKINKAIEKAYYWRDYNGELPDDAVPGGLDKHGKTTYIGQALHPFPPNGKLIPGKIDASEKKMYYACNWSEYVVLQNIKILCSQNLENFEWIETDIKKIKALPQSHNLVLGGYDTAYPLFIGRKQTDGEVVLGKVTIFPPFDAFGYTINQKAVFVEDTFEILSYKPKIPK